MFKILLALRYSDLKETVIGMRYMCKTLGFFKGIRAILYSSMKQYKAMLQGGGSYPEAGKRRIWFKMFFLKIIYDYLKRKNENDAYQLFEKIIEGPGKAYVGGFAPPAKRFTKEYTLNSAWKDFIETDYNIEVTVDEAVNNSTSLHVTRCFMNEVVRDIGLMPVSELICGCDFVFWKDHHPNIRFTRDKTLLRGYDYCNHTLTWVEVDN